MWNFRDTAGGHVHGKERKGKRGKEKGRERETERERKERKRRKDLQLVEVN